MSTDHADARVRDAIALTFASLFPLVMAYIYFVVLDNPDGEPNPTFLLAFGVGKFIQFLFPALYVAWFDYRSIRFRWPSWRGFPLGVGFALLVAAGMFGLYFGVVRDLPGVNSTTPDMIFSRLQQFNRATPMDYLQLAIGICLVHSLWEEYYWRWFVYGWMRRHMPMAAAIALSSIGFMLHHIVILGVYFPDNFWMLALPFSVCVGIGGGVWAWLYERSEALYAPWLSHCLIDAAIMALGYVMLSERW